MPKYAILRDLPLTLTRTELDGMAMEGLVAADLYPLCRTQQGNPGIEWVRTYWQPGSNWGLCLYEAPSAEELWDFQRSCGMEAVEIREVTEQRSDVTCDAAGELSDAIAGSQLTAVEIPLNADGENALAASGTWIRTYSDSERQTAIALYATSDSEQAPSAAQDDSSIHLPVVEIAAAAYRS
ncbi:MAG: DUF4242 domain-containing protein [Chloroflexi bacterium]|nr:DUF4242 domain-containing protein [Chloroflexota bacterium]